MQLSEYQQMSQKNLQEAETLLREGDYHRASEKLWGAAASMVEAIAEERGWDHHGHLQLHHVVSRLAHETSRPDLVRLFSAAGTLHTNFYQDRLPPDQVTELADQVRLLLAELGRIAEA